jgi:hypothetical protein
MSPRETEFGVWRGEQLWASLRGPRGTTTTAVPSRRVSIWGHGSKWQTAGYCRFTEHGNRRDHHHQPRGGLHGSWRGAGVGLWPPTEGRARAGRVQRSKGSTGTTRTRRRAAPGWPGGVLRTQRTTQPSWMCSFDDIWWYLRTWGVPTSTPGN